MKKNNLLRTLAVATACAVLSACATTGTATATAPGSASTIAVGAYRDAIDLTGRLLVNYERDGKPDTLSVKFAWAQSARETGVSLLSPTGQTVAKISVTPDAATLTQAGQNPRTARNIDALAAQTLGFALPVSGLRDWLQGYASAADGTRFAASPANNTVTTPDGWKLTFVSWQDPPSGLPAPRRIDATRDAVGNAGALALRIVIDPKG